MGHTLNEGLLLLRQRSLVSAVLALTLAIPLCFFGFSLAVGKWLAPLAELGNERLTVPVLLHPHADEQLRLQWLEGQVDDNPEWIVRRLDSNELASRLSTWFPYLTDLFDEDPGLFLPQMIEIETSEPESLDGLVEDPVVIAVGPRHSMNRTIGEVSQKARWLVVLTSLLLLASATLLTGIWIHLELYRHADEITIMRLIGATEATIRGPFYLVSVAPGVLAGAFSVFATLTLARAVSQLTVSVGLPAIKPMLVIYLVQMTAGILLPLTATARTLSRHAASESFDA
jgi:cell division protein FtsX